MIVISKGIVEEWCDPTSQAIKAYICLVASENLSSRADKNKDMWDRGLRLVTMNKSLDPQSIREAAGNSKGQRLKSINCLAYKDK